VEQVDLAVAAIGETTTMAHGSGQALGAIVKLVSHTSQQVRTIALGAQEQASAVREVTEAVSDISRVAAQTSEGMEESAQAVQDLMNLTERLRGLIDAMAQDQPSALT
jgi:methyl-accepting chemotaxis protein